MKGFPMLEQVGWYSPKFHTFHRMYEVNPQAPEYRGDHIACYVFEAELQP